MFLYENTGVSKLVTETRASATHLVRYTPASKLVAPDVLSGSKAGAVGLLKCNPLVSKKAFPCYIPIFKLDYSVEPGSPWTPYQQISKGLVGSTPCLYMLGWYGLADNDWGFEVALALRISIPTGMPAYSKLRLYYYFSSAISGYADSHAYFAYNTVAGGSYHAFEYFHGGGSADKTVTPLTWSPVPTNEDFYLFTILQQPPDDYLSSCALYLISVELLDSSDGIVASIPFGDMAIFPAIKSGPAENSNGVYQII